MKNAFKSALLAMTLALPSAAGAATVAAGGTTVGDVNGIAAVGGTSYTAFGLYGAEATAQTSEWVWHGTDAVFGNEDRYWRFDFDLTNYDVTTAVVSGLWGANNIGVAWLNGVQIGNVAFGGFNNPLTTYGTSDATLFNAGTNTIFFGVRDTFATGGFRATVEVTADLLPAVPLPASAPLMVFALGGLIVVARRRRT